MNGTSAEPSLSGVGFRIFCLEDNSCSTTFSEGDFVLISVCQTKTQGGNCLKAICVHRKYLCTLLQGISYADGASFLRESPLSWTCNCRCWHGLIISIMSCISGTLEQIAYLFQCSDILVDLFFVSIYTIITIYSSTWKGASA